MPQPNSARFSDVPGETSSHHVQSSRSQIAMSPKAAPGDIRPLVEKIEIDLVDFRVDVRQQLADLMHRVATLERRERTLETRQDKLEKDEKVLEKRESQLEKLVNLEEKTNHLQLKLEEFRESTSAQGGAFTTEKEMIARHQSRPSAQLRVKEGVTVDFLEVEADELYHFDESVWDIAIFIGTPSLGIGGSLLTCVALLMNVLVQVVFTAIVMFNFAESTINELTLEGALAWRTGIAHQYQFLESDTSPSLVSRVCGGDLSLQIATAQTNMYQDVSEYLKPEASGLEAVFDGRVMCLVALVCWFLMVSKEVHKALDLFRAVIYVPRGPDKLEPLEIPMQPTRYVVATMSMSRVLFSTVIVIYRLVLSAVLAYSGTNFLVYTIQITELILNAVALEIILNIDDLLFDAVTTANARHLVVRLEAIKMPRWPHCKGVDLKATCMAVILPVLTILIYVYMISPMVQDLQLLSEHLCGGNRDYVFSENLLRMVVIAPTDAFGTDFQSNASVREMAVQEAIGQKTISEREASSYAIWVDSTFRLRTMQALGFDETIDLVVQDACQDQLSGPLLQYARDIMEDSSIETCADVQQFCTSPSFYPEFMPDGGRGIMARLACPQTCGCDNPASSLLTHIGCPSMCTSMAHLPYRAALQANCTEQENVQNTSTWLAWVKQVRAYGVFRNPIYEALADQMSVLGCGIADTTSCFWPGAGKDLKQITHLCPHSCQCWESWSPQNCPHCEGPDKEDDDEKDSDDGPPRGG